MNKFLLVLVVLIGGTLAYFTFYTPQKAVTTRGSRLAFESVKKQIDPAKVEKEKENLGDFGRKVYEQKGKAVYEYSSPKKIPKAKVVPLKKKPVVKPKLKPKLKPKSKQ